MALETIMLKNPKVSNIFDGFKKELGLSLNNTLHIDRISYRHKI
jgi:hypothetical protein